MCIITDGSEKPIPWKSEPLTNNKISMVYRGNDGWIYKRSIPFLIENELWCLQHMQDTGFVPKAQRHDKYTLKIEDLGESDPVFDKDKFRSNMYDLLNALERKKIRHGDITTYSIIVKADWPYLIDFAKSRLGDDPRPDKRKEGDRYWLERTIHEIAPTVES